MAYTNAHGRARVDPRSPQAFAVCDNCGEWVNRVDLRAEQQWMGPELRPTGFLVCDRCLDVPQQQFRTIIMPPDPVPVDQPRPEIPAPAIDVLLDTQSLVLTDNSGMPLYAFATSLQ